ncbi:MAG: hypothetical protein NVSMB9_22120 [Isosphaeraceae bacterium]
MAETSAHPVSAPWFFMLVLAAGAVSGLGSWVLGERVNEYFKPPSRLVHAMGVTMDSPTEANQIIANVRNAALTFGILGALLGGTFGLAGGMARGSFHSGGAAALLGLVLGSALGAVASLVLVPVFFRYVDPMSNDLLIPLLIHGGVWGAAGASGGLALGIGLGGRGPAVRGLLGGLFGAVIGAVLYEVTGAMFFPLAKTGLPVAPTPGIRLMAWALLSLSAAFFAAVSIADLRKLPRKPAPAPEAG